MTTQPVNANRAASATRQPDAGFDDYKADHALALLAAGRANSACWEAGAIRDVARRDALLAQIDAAGSESEGER